jgi:hypothetical protein
VSLRATGAVDDRSAHSRPVALTAIYNRHVTTINPSDLTDLERVLLAVLGAGLAPSSLANDPSFRLDALCGTTLALLRGEPPLRYLMSDHEATPEFRASLSEAIYDLSDRRVLMSAEPAPSTFVALEGEQPAPTDRSVPVNFDFPPSVFDRYLAGRCLDELLRNADVYRFIMGKYAESSEIWQRIARQGG